MATTQEMWESEYNKFIAELSGFVNKEINDFKRSIVVMSDSLRDFCIFNTHNCKFAQATSQWMDRVQNQVTHIRSDLKEQIERVVIEVNDELRTEFKAALDRKAVSLETYVESRVNEVRQEPSSTLKQLKETIAAVRESQERMWRAIDGRSKDAQELVQKDASTEDDEDTKPKPVVEEPAPAGTSAIAQWTPEKTVPARTFFLIPEEDVVSVKDSVTSRVLAHGSMKGMEAGGSSGHPTTPHFKFTSGHVVEEGSTEDIGKTALVPQKEEKRELSFGLMVMSGWKSRDYSAPTEEFVLRVGKSTGMLGTTSRGFVPHTAGVGQMKLEASPQYLGKRQPGSRVWLTQMERYM